MFNLPGQQKRAALGLCATELFERFGFYVIQSLLVLYLVQHYNMTDMASYNLLGIFIVLVYIASILGGYIADNFIGHYQCVTTGGVLLIIGYAGVPIASENWFLWPLSFIVLGTGFFKPNLASIYGSQINNNDSVNHTKAFTFFYMATNVGVILSTIFAGLLASYVSWNASFLSAAICLMLSVSIFVLSLKYQYNDSSINEYNIYKRFPHFLGLIFTVLVSLSFIYFIFRFEIIDNLFFVIFGVTFLVLLLKKTKSLSSSNKQKLYACLIISALSLCFWVIDFQIFFSFNLFISRSVNREVLGWQIPPSFFIGYLAMIIILMGPVINKLWDFLAKFSFSPSAPAKLSLSIGCALISVVLLLAAIYMSDGNTLISPGWILLSYTFIGVGELFCAPVCLSMITKSLPSHLTGFMLSIWYVFSAGISGKLASLLASKVSVPQSISTLTLIKQTYSNGFLLYIVFLVTSGVLIFICLPFLQRMLNGKTPYKLATEV